MMNKKNFEDHPSPLRDLMRQPPTSLAAHRAQIRLRVDVRRKLEDLRLERLMDAGDRNDR